MPVKGDHGKLKCTVVWWLETAKLATNPDTKLMWKVLYSHYIRLKPNACVTGYKYTKSCIKKTLSKIAGKYHRTAITFSGLSDVDKHYNIQEHLGRRFTVVLYTQCGICIIWSSIKPYLRTRSAVEVNDMQN